MEVRELGQLEPRLRGLKVSSIRKKLVIPGTPAPLVPGPGLHVPPHA